MKKLLFGGLIFLIFLLITSTVFATDTTQFSGSSCPITITNPSESIKLGPNSKVNDNIYIEVPPIVIGNTSADYKMYYFSTDRTFACSVGPSTNILTDKLYPVATSNHAQNAWCNYSLGSNTFDYYYNHSNQKIPVAEFNRIAPSTYWKTNYYGSYSVQKLNTPIGETDPWIITFNSGENKNEPYNSTSCYQNTVHPSVACLNCYSGIDPTSGYYQDCTSAYSGFIGMSHTTTSAASNYGATGFIDEGPIIWPQEGYISTQVGAGLSESIIKDGYIYLFYIDSRGFNYARETSLARAPVSGKGLPGTFKKYYNESFTESALPTNFSKSNPVYTAKSGKSSPLFSTSPSTLCSLETYAPTSDLTFKVAKLKGTEYYLGVEQEYAGNTFVNVLRVSKDLIHWSNGVSVPGTKYPASNFYSGFGTKLLLFSVFL